MAGKEDRARPEGPRLEEGQHRFREAMKGISALCVRRPVLTIVANLLIVLAGIAAFQRRRDPRAARGRPPGDHGARQLRGRDAGDDRQAGHRRHRGRGVARPRRQVDLLVEPLRRKPRRGGVRRQRRPQRRGERPARRRRQRRAAAAGRCRRSHHREGGRQFRRDHAARRDGQSDDDRGPDPARRGHRGRSAAAVDGVADGERLWRPRAAGPVLIDPNALAARGLSVTDLETALDTVALDAPAGSLTGDEPVAPGARRRQRDERARRSRRSRSTGRRGSATSPT